MGQDDTIGMSLGSLEKSKEASKNLFALDIPGYEVKRELGRGSFGTVYEAVRLHTGQRVALKVVMRERCLHWDYFARELALLLDLEDHPYTLTVLDADLGHDPPFIVTPLVEGGTLHTVEGQPLDKIEGWIAQVAEALSYIHSKGVIHCDLKPSNIFLSGSKTIRVGDFGQSRRAIDGEAAYGTIGFMAPEQCLVDPHKRITPSVRWDVYGFGATAYWLLTGTRARVRDEDIERLTLVTGAGQRARFYHDCLRTNPLRPIRSLNPKVDPALAAIVEACLEVEPEKRTASMQEVLDDLRRRSLGYPLHCRRPWSLLYLTGLALRSRVVQLLILLVILLCWGGYYEVCSARERQFSFHSEGGLHALESGRLEEAYLHFLAALNYRAHDRTTQARLSFLPIAMTFPHGDGVQGLAFSADGSRLGTASTDETARVWDSASGSLLARIEHGAPVWRIAFSPVSPDLVATAAWDGTALLYDLAGKRKLARLKHPGEPAPNLKALEFRGDGRQLATAAEDGSVRLWEVPSGRSLPLEPPPHPEGVVQPSLSFTRDGKLLAGPAGSRSARVWDTATGKAVGPLLSHEGDINDFEFHPREAVLATGGDDRCVRLWQVPSGRMLMKMTCESRVNTIRFSRAGDMLAAGGDDGTVRVWRLKDPGVPSAGGSTEEPESFDFPHSRPVRDLDFSPDGTLLAVGTAEKQVLWSPIEPNGAARVWSLADQQPVTDALPHDGPVTRVLFHPDGTRLAVASAEGRRTSALYRGMARTWMVSLPAAANNLPLTAAPASPRGEIVEKTRVVVQDAQGRELCSVAHGEMINLNAFTISLDGTSLATAGEDRVARVWLLPSGKPRAHPIAHTDPVVAVAFSPRGDWLATAATTGSGSSIRVWETSTGAPVTPPLYCPENQVKLEFSADGNTLIGAGSKRSYGWRVEPDPPLSAESVVRRVRARLDETGALLAQP